MLLCICNKLTTELGSNNQRNERFGGTVQCLCGSEVCKRCLSMKQLKGKRLSVLLRYINHTSGWKVFLMCVLALVKPWAIWVKIVTWLKCLWNKSLLFILWVMLTARAHYFLWSQWRHTGIWGSIYTKWRWNVFTDREAYDGMVWQRCSSLLQ